MPRRLSPLSFSHQNEKPRLANQSDAHSRINAMFEMHQKDIQEADNELISTKIEHTREYTATDLPPRLTTLNDSKDDSSLFIDDTITLTANRKIPNIIPGFKL